MTSPVKPKLTDNPLENATLAKIARIEFGGPYVYTCRNGKHQVAFPDLDELGWEDGEAFLADVAEQRESVWLPKWLSAEDFARIRAEKWSFSELASVVRDLLEHYGKVAGTPGEDDASRA
jgi:hypothetical protein